MLKRATFKAVALCALIAAAPAPAPISAERIRADVRTLASDAFDGRGPGEKGEAATIEFIARSFAKAGLEPGGGICGRR